VSLLEVFLMIVVLQKHVYDSMVPVSKKATGKGYVSLFEEVHTLPPPYSSILVFV